MYGTPAAADGGPPDPEPQLVPLGPAHLEACQALDQRSLGGLWSRQQWATELAEPQRPGIGLWQGSQLQGLACGWLILEELHITLLAVDPAHRRRGLGRRLLRALLAEARRRGAERATLEVASGNAAALALYASVGFREAGRRRGYYRSGDDALIQWLRLEPPPGAGDGPAAPFCGDLGHSH